MIHRIVKAIEFVRIDENGAEDALGSISSLFGNEVIKRDFLDTWDLWDALSLVHCLDKLTARGPMIVCTSLVNLPNVALRRTLRENERHALPDLDF